MKLYASWRNGAIIFYAGCMCPDAARSAQERHCSTGLGQDGWGQRWFLALKAEHGAHSLFLSNTEAVRSKIPLCFCRPFRGGGGGRAKPFFDPGGFGRLGLGFVPPEAGRNRRPRRGAPGHRQAFVFLHKRREPEPRNRSQRRGYGLRRTWDSLEERRPRNAPGSKRKSPDKIWALRVPSRSIGLVPGRGVEPLFPP